MAEEGPVTLILECKGQNEADEADGETSFVTEMSFDKTPLHCAISEGKVEMVNDLLENGAEVSINKAENNGWTPLHLAVNEGTVEIVKVLLEKGAKASINKADNLGRTPVHFACFFGRTEILIMLLATERADLEKTDKYNHTPLQMAIMGGHEDAAKAILMRPDRETTRKLLFKSFINYRNQKTTPLRFAIGRVPDVAAMMLDCCTDQSEFLSNNRTNYELILHYSILDDEKLFLKAPELGPTGFDRKNLPLNLIAQSENLKLLKHPLVTYFLKRKWRVPAAFYLIWLLFYCTFLSFLTAFALTVPSPLSGSCHSVSGALGNASFVDGCELSDSRQQFLFTAAIFVVIFAFIRLIGEVFQMCQHKVQYFTDWLNWMEFFMAVFAIIFVWVFHTDCLCAYDWQWQIGTVAIFLAWFDFVIFVQKLPIVGIYVAMLEDILKSFIKTIPLAIMLVIAFALGFFMLFSEPGILRSPFSTPARALLTTVAYSTGGFDYNGVFRLTRGGTENSDVEEIPFPPVSYILFILFVIIMSILLSNLLAACMVQRMVGIQQKNRQIISQWICHAVLLYKTALAVGDTDRILRNAEAKNIAQKIQLILSVEAILPAKFRHRLFVVGETVYPNRPPWGEWKLWQQYTGIYTTLPWWKRWLPYLLKKYLEWYPSVPKGIEISGILKREDNSLKGLTKKVLSLTKDVQDMKQTMETVLKGDDNSLEGLTKKVQDMKQTMDDDIEKLKQSQERIEQMLKDLLQRVPKTQ